VAMYLVRRCCDRTSEETAKLFGVGSYGTVGWASHGIKSKAEEEREFRDRVEKIIQRIYQPKTKPPDGSQPPLRLVQPHSDCSMSSFHCRFRDFFFGIVLAKRR
jgi:hypothetical protein